MWRAKKDLLKCNVWCAYVSCVIMCCLCVMYVCVSYVFVCHVCLCATCIYVSCVFMCHVGLWYHVCSVSCVLMCHAFSKCVCMFSVMCDYVLCVFRLMFVREMSVQCQVCSVLCLCGHVCSASGVYVLCVFSVKCVNCVYYHVLCVLSAMWLYAICLCVISF